MSGRAGVAWKDCQRAAASSAISGSRQFRSSPHDTIRPRCQPGVLGRVGPEMPDAGTERSLENSLLHLDAMSRVASIRYLPLKNLLKEGDGPAVVFRRPNLGSSDPRGDQLPSLSWCGHQSGDLHQVVVEDPVTAPGAGSFDPVDLRPAPTEVPFEAADPAFASGPPPHEVLECRRTNSAQITARIVASRDISVTREPAAVIHRMTAAALPAVICLEWRRWSERNTPGNRSLPAKMPDLPGPRHFLTDRW